MKFSDYLKKRELSIHKFALEAGLPQMAIWELVARGRDSRSSTLLAISQATTGSCTMEEIALEFIDRCKKKKKIAIKD